MNKHKRVLGIFISSILLGCALFISLIVTTWGILISIDTIFTIAITLPLLYFLLLFILINIEGELTTNQTTLNFLSNQIGVIIIIPIITVVVVFVYSSYDESLNPNYNLFKYSGYPCENKTFSTTEKTILVAYNISYMHEGAYFITHNVIEEYNQNYLEHRGEVEYIEKKIYPIGSKFKVIGFYWPYGTIHYYLIQNVEDNKTIAWVSQNEFDSKECHINFYSQQIYPIKNNTFSPKNGEYNETKIDLSKMQMKPFI